MIRIPKGISHLKKLNMKIRILLFVAVLGFAATSCEKFKDLASVEKDVDFKVDIPLEATDDAASISLKSVNAFGDFAGSAEIDLATNNDVKDYVDGLRNISATTANLNSPGLSGDQKIETITITAEVEDANYTKSSTATNITASTIDTKLDELVDFINNWDVKQYTKVKFTVTGKANFHVTSDVKAKITIPSTVKYSPL